MTSERTWWDSSWSLVTDLLNLTSSQWSAVASGTDAYALCLKLCQAGVVHEGLGLTRLWRLAPGVTREHARAVLKALALAHRMGPS